MQSPAFTLQVQQFDLFRSLKQFFGLRAERLYRKSRIRRKYARPFEEFTFVGYDINTPDIFQPHRFRDLRHICKN